VQTAPEIQRTSLVAAVLYLKSLPLSIDVLGFDYLDAPAVRGARLPACMGRGGAGRAAPACMGRGGQGCALRG
jgi:ATP-dependent RNA helicase DHX8/PRP22